MSGSFTFNGTSSASLGLLVNNVSNFGAPSRVVEKIQVPYRNGDLLIDTGAYNNYIVTYHVSLINSAVADTRAIAAWLLKPQGYCALTDTYNTGETRYAAYFNQIDYTMAHLNRYGEATISFDCKPQRFLDSGSNTTTVSSIAMVLSNPTGFISKPLIQVFGNGTFTVGSFSVTVADNAGDSLYIDCESMQCYRGTTNMNSSVELPNGFPTLNASMTTVDKGTTTKLVITPRWWRL